MRRFHLGFCRLTQSAGRAVGCGRSREEKSIGKCARLAQLLTRRATRVKGAHTILSIGPTFTNNANNSDTQGPVDLYISLKTTTGTEKNGQSGKHNHEWAQTTALSMCFCSMRLGWQNFAFSLNKTSGSGLQRNFSAPLRASQPPL